MILEWMPQSRFAQSAGVRTLKHVILTVSLLAIPPVSADELESRDEPAPALELPLSVQIEPKPSPKLQRNPNAGLLPPFGGTPVPAMPSLFPIIQPKVTYSTEAEPERVQTNATAITPTVIQPTIDEDVPPSVLLEGDIPKQIKILENINRNLPIISPEPENITEKPIESVVIENSIENIRIFGNISTPNIEPKTVEEAKTDVPLTPTPAPLVINIEPPRTQNLEVTITARGRAPETQQIIAPQPELMRSALMARFTQRMQATQAPASMKDDDGDGTFDFRDQCPQTQLNEKTDLDGCSDAQRAAGVPLNLRK